jgi:hypothetical protein
MPNSYYNHSTYPTPNSPGSSAQLRSELELITTGFNKLPTLTGNGYKVAMINVGGTALVASSDLQSLAITSSTINGTTIGGISAAAGTFTNLIATGTVNLGSTVTVAGGTINGTQIGNSSPAAGAFTTLSASSGITGSLTGNVTASSGTSAFTNVTVSGTLTASLTGNVTAASGTSTFNNVTINGTLDMNSGSVGTITGLALPTVDSDAANKAYVDQVAQGLDAKASVRAATTANITLSGTQTIDTVALIAGDRVLVKDQGTASENGIYEVASGSWTRTSDTNAWTELISAFVFVEDGTANGNNGYVCTVKSGGTLGVTAVTWVQFSGAGQITAGNGMTKTGNTLNVGTASVTRIVVNADDIDLASSGITPGTYRSLTIDAYGRATSGTNPTTISGYAITDAYTKTEIDSIFGSTTSAAASASAAATSASNALTSENNASTYAGNALTSANNAAASYDAFDDRYLGAKASDPAVDNDGNPLLTGALYWNTTVGQIRVYNGSAWIAAYLPAGGYLALTGGTMTGTINFAVGQTFPGAGTNITLINDTSTASNLYPTFADATTGTVSNLYTGNAKLLYKPSTGDLQASQMVSTNGLMVNSTTVSASYTVAAGTNAMSVGPITVASGQSVTVSSGQRWVVI